MSGPIIPDVTFQDLLRKISSRNAVLFIGSGFSASAHSLNNEKMPVARVLAQRIGDLKNFNAEKDLRYASDRYLSRGGDRDELVRMLRETFSVRSVEDHHKAIASVPWRRIYTTNYDLCYERAAEQIGKLIETVDISENQSDFSARNDVCVHLNGSIKNLKSEALESGFKLTTSSYLSPQSFLTSPWYYPFQRDLEFSSAIIFVGYSMYDIEIQKILHSNPEYILKTFFITLPMESERDLFTLEQFGTVLPIGTEIFGKEIAGKIKDWEAESEELVLASLWEYEASEEGVQIRDSDVEAFLMYGEVSDDIFDAAVSGAKGAPLLILRDDLKDARELLKAGANLVVTADFGNGKSIFLRMLRTHLALEGMRCFTADQADFHHHDDLEKIVKRGIKGYLFIDSYEQNLDLIRHYSELKPTNLQLIIAARSSIHERCSSSLVALGLTLHELAIDDLSQDEVGGFIRIVDNIGSWGAKATPSLHDKHAFLQSQHNQLCPSLLAILSSPQIVNRVSELLSELLGVHEYRDTVFAVALISFIDMPLNSSLISEVAKNDKIYSIELRNNERFRQLFNIKGTRVTTKSSIFAGYLISQHFQASYIVDQLLKITASLDRGADDLREIQKNLLRFSVVERLLPERQRMQNLVRYYENLKREIPWLNNDPHFWLQYGMARLTYKDFNKAQAYFDQAYALARQKPNYHTNYIDTQQARLFLLQSAHVDEPSESFKLFSEAHKLLLGLPDDAHKYRQVQNYRDVFERKFTLFSKSNKVAFEHACKAVLVSLGRVAISSGAPSRLRVFAHTTEIIQKILDKIKSE